MSDQPNITEVINRLEGVSTKIEVAADILALIAAYNDQSTRLLKFIMANVGDNFLKKRRHMDCFDLAEIVVRWAAASDRLVVQVDNQLAEATFEIGVHHRLHGELNTILHPNGGGPEKPSLCDLVSFVRRDLADAKAAIERLTADRDKWKAMTIRVCEHCDAVVSGSLDRPCDACGHFGGEHISIAFVKEREKNAAPDKPTYARVQPCGCVLCVCDDEDKCHGCGAKRCGDDGCDVRRGVRVYETDRDEKEVGDG